VSKDFPDKTRAILRAPLHVVLSIPPAAISLVAPSIGEAYIAVRQEAEDADYKQGRDSARKAAVDLKTQTFLVKVVLKLWGR